MPWTFEIRKLNISDEPLPEMLNGIVKEVPRGSAEFHMVANKQSRGQRSGPNPLYNIHKLERERERERGKMKRKYLLI